MTARLSDAALCAQIEADAMGRWDGFSVLDLVSRYRHAVMRAKLRAVVDRSRARQLVKYGWDRLFCESATDAARNK